MLGCFYIKLGRRAARINLYHISYYKPFIKKEDNKDKYFLHIFFSDGRERLESSFESVKQLDKVVKFLDEHTSVLTINIDDEDENLDDNAIEMQNN